MTNEEKRYFALHYICTFFGVVYRWGGESPVGIDCSGLGQEYLRSVGMDPEGDQGAQGLYRHFRDKEVGKATAGALVFYGKSTTKITHVGICMTDELMIEAGGGGSRTTSDAAAHRHKAFVRMRPIDRRSDLVAICDPFQD
jgi:cell wall-associated NlpC family hydrolase